ncbi:MAG: YfhO family protein [Acidimicrobiales bacterium]
MEPEPHPESEAPPTAELGLLWLIPVVATCGLSLALLRPELTRVPYLNDSAMHEEMVRFALAKIRADHFPPDSWFPFLNLGSPQYLHYQSLGAMLTALLAWVIGVGHAFTLTTWLLIGCWPLCIYAAARIFGMRPDAAMAAAVLSPFVSSFTGVGYEQISYLWIGFGLWSQLWAMWTLPLAWALSWRAVEERRYVVPAAIAIAATAAFHFQTGYLAFAGIALFVLARPSQLLPRAGRAFLVAAGAGALAAWALVPLVVEGKWAAVNEFLLSGPDTNSYGARKVLAALFTGNILDWHHLMLITPLCLAGLALCLYAWWRPDFLRPVEHGASRGLVLVFVCSLCLFFGRPTLGPLLDLVPGSKDLFLRRFIVGVQLAGLLLAGVAAAQLARWVLAGTRRVLKARARTAIGVLAVGCVALAAVVPAWSYIVNMTSRNASLISEQSAAGPRAAAAQVDALIATINRKGGGRTFAGHPSDWGADFTVGEVPVYEYLASSDVDEVGFTLRTASLMSDPEAKFDEDNPADYRAFGIRWLVLPSGMEPPVSAARVEARGSYVLWEIPGDGYVQVVDTRGTIVATSADLGSVSARLLADLPASNPVYPTVAYGDSGAAPGTLPAGEHPFKPPGRVLSETSNLSGGTVVAKVSVARTSVVLLSASFDPGWQAFVDGHQVATEMVAPALVGVRVTPGVHTIRFVYRGFGDYPPLFALGAVALVALAIIERRRPVKSL